MTKTQSAAARLIVLAVYETVAETGAAGAPAGVVFAALRTHGCRISQFLSIEQSMRDLGILTKTNGVLYAVPSVAREFGFGVVAS